MPVRQKNQDVLLGCRVISGAYFRLSKWIKSCIGLLIGSVCLCLISCLSPEYVKKSLINTAHLDHLYLEFEFEGQPVALVYIYTDFPDYKPVVAPGEGIACVDDMARAVIFYLRYYRHSGGEEYLLKARRLLKMILMMQADNGYFYNFIDEHYLIEKEIPNSRPEGNWWSWRAMWAIAEAYDFWRERDEEFGRQLNESMQRAIAAVREMDRLYPQKVMHQDHLWPAWLPRQYAADQAAVLLMALVPYFRNSADTTLLPIMSHLGEGILTMQIRDGNHYTDGAFLSWPMLWHAYGNNQASALLLSFHLIRDETWLHSARREIDQFYPALMQRGFRNYLIFDQLKDSVVIKEERQFEQIAYGIRPMVWAALEAYEITGQEAFAIQAAEMSLWLLGKNPAGQIMYDLKTGRCFDGIDSAEDVNYDSGAESTIEALLTLLEIEKCIPAQRHLLINSGVLRHDE